MFDIMNVMVNAAIVLILFSVLYSILRDRIKQLRRDFRGDTKALLQDNIPEVYMELYLFDALLPDDRTNIVQAYAQVGDKIVLDNDEYTVIKRVVEATTLKIYLE